MTQLLVIGGASSDLLHLPGNQFKTAGGAGMYTAMAAKRAGVQVSMFGPKPDPMPAELHAVETGLTEWLGPVIPLNHLPHFEISYLNETTDYLDFNIDAESSLLCSTLPEDLSIYDVIHVTPLGDIAKQMEFIRACRNNGARRISSGTCLMHAEEEPDKVLAVINESDFSFLNQAEAQAVYGSIDSVSTDVGRLIFITCGSEGARVIQGNYATEISAVPGEVLDPTGAGDTFCGSSLAHLILGRHPVIAAQYAAALATKMIAYAGPSELLNDDPNPDYPLKKEVLVSQGKVQKVAQLVANLSESKPFDFIGPMFPVSGDPLALDWFFIATLQQFGFWTTNNGIYEKPLIAPMGGNLHKGSDYLWYAYMRMLELDPHFFTLERQASLTLDEMKNLFRADDGSDPMPAIGLHLQQARQYAQDMLALNLTPQEIIQETRISARPIKTLFELLDHVGGYKEDPLRKKSGLLAFILNQRPERFLEFGPLEDVSPVIDYHAMRSCLRTGLVEILDANLVEKVKARQELNADEEQAIRFISYQAIQQVANLSRKSMGAVDWFFFNSRKRCPEMTEPDCQQCPVDPICAHDKDLFQPVFRTTFY